MKPLSMKLLMFFFAALVVSSAVFANVSLRNAHTTERLRVQKQIQQDDEDYRRQLAAGKSR